MTTAASLAVVPVGNTLAVREYDASIADRGDDRWAGIDGVPCMMIQHSNRILGPLMRHIHCELYLNNGAYSMQ
jgi:hypothetical protein